jgi:hypothetical protein
VPQRGINRIILSGITCTIPTKGTATSGASAPDVIKLRVMIRIALLVACLSSPLFATSLFQAAASTPPASQPLAACEAKLLELPRPEQFRRHHETAHTRAARGRLPRKLPGRRVPRGGDARGGPEGRAVRVRRLPGRTTSGPRPRWSRRCECRSTTRRTSWRRTASRPTRDCGPGWNAFSGSGDVTGQVVFAHHGRKEDFEALAKMGVSVKGKVVIARYGGNFRGYKAKYAEEAGAIGLIIYTDPADGGYVPPARCIPKDDSPTTAPCSAARC